MRQSTLALQTSGQPRGLYYLFLTEMWERYSFHGMRALLVLYMTTQITSGGLGFENEAALKLYSYYLAGAYISPVLGGFIADRWLGHRFCSYIGGLLMAMGHLLMTVHQVEVLYIAIALVCLGNGFFKPNITTLLGGLYTASDTRRDGGFSIFYMGINIGAMLAGFINGYLQQTHGFDSGFFAAALGMVIGLSILMSCPRIDLQPVVQQVEQVTAVDEMRSTGDVIDDGQKRRLAVIAMLCLAVLFFMISFGQSGGLVNLYCNRWADRLVGGWRIPSAFFLSLNPIFGLMLAPALSIFWLRGGRKPAFASQKMAMGLGSVALAFMLLWFVTPSNIMEEPGTCHSLWLAPFYFLLTVGEMCILPVLWSSISWLSPRPWVSSLMAMGLFAMGMGGYIAGQIGSWVDSVGPAFIFGGLAGISSMMSLALWKLSPLLESLSKDSPKIAKSWIH